MNEIPELLPHSYEPWTPDRELGDNPESSNTLQFRDRRRFRRPFDVNEIAGPACYRAAVWIALSQ